jgi:hypothetical protein
VLKQENLDKFESQSSDGVFLGYALHSCAYCVLNLVTNRIMETCELTFDETSPSPSPIFELAGPDHMGQTIFVEEEQDNTDWGDPEPSPPAAPVEPASTTSVDGPNITSSMTWGPVEPEPTEPRRGEATIEGEDTSSREAP